MDREPLKLKISYAKARDAYNGKDSMEDFFQGEKLQVEVPSSFLDELASENPDDYLKRLGEIEKALRQPQISFLTQTPKGFWILSCIRRGNGYFACANVIKLDGLRLVSNGPHKTRVEVER